MPQVKDRAIFEEARSDACLALESFDEDDVALVDHVELLGISGPSKRLAVDRLAVTEHADVVVGFAVALRMAQPLEVGEWIKLPAENALGVLSPYKRAVDAEDP